jgi:hypothetical protein
MNERVTLSEYARRRNCSKSLVSEAIRTGRIDAKREMNGKRVVVMIDPIEANRQWDERTDPTQMMVGQMRRQINKAAAPTAGIPAPEYHAWDESVFKAYGVDVGKQILPHCTALATLLSGVPPLGQSQAVAELMEHLTNAIYCQLEEINGFQP